MTRLAIATLRRRLRGEEGSLLIEVVVTAALLIVVALGVYQALDNADARGAEQKAKSIAGNLAQAELERLRALPLAELSNNYSVGTKTVGGQLYDIESRAAWVTDATGTANCATDAPADYLQITTTVKSTHLRKRKPVTLDSIMTPPARSFGPDEGGLSVQILDRNGAGVSGLVVSLTGPRNVSGVTNENGCVLWGYLPAANDYTLTFSREDWLEPTGFSGQPTTVAVVGEQTRNIVKEYDQSGTIGADFVTQLPRARPDDADGELPTAPLQATLEHPGPPSRAFPQSVDASRLDTQPLYPFTSEYSIYADNCPAARPGTPVFVKALPGIAVEAGKIALPALDMKVVEGATPVSGAIVKVLSACGTQYTRTTRGDGLLADPGFPYGTGLAICVQTASASHKKELAPTNNLDPAGQAIDVDLAGEPSGTCP